tara:strand:+ start:1 stop:987 length:987 start_codon:yes stop_codon:yes gene_type:complete
MPKLKIGIIGYRNHSKKLIALFNNHHSVREIISYCYKKEKIENLNKLNTEKKVFYTSKLKSLYNCDSIVISSSTGTHIKYLKKFIRKKKNIFCEKPGPININDVNYLKNLPFRLKKNIFFGQNLIFSDLFYSLKKILKKKIYGTPIYSTITITNGISFKRSMINNWRFNSKSVFKKITGNVGIHYIGLMSSLFGSIKKMKIEENGTQKKNKTDNSFIDLDFSNKLKCKIYLSYSTVVEEELRIFLTNAQLVFDGKRINIYHPRDTFGKNGNFIKPPKKILKRFNASWSDDSLKNTVGNFLKKCLSKKNFNLKEYNNFLKLNEFLIKNK